MTRFDAHANLPIGADVYTADGERVGCLMGGGIHELEVGDGFLFMTIYTVPVAWVERYDDGHLILWLTAAQFEAAMVS